MTTKLALLTLALTAAAQTQQAVSINLASATGVTSIPGGTGTFTAHPADPCISFGAIAFRGTGALTDAGTQQGIYATLGGALTRTADLNTLIPSGIGTFVEFPVDPIISGGNIAFLALGSGGQQGIYVNWAGVLTRIADLNTSIPSGSGHFTGFSPGDPYISGANVVFVGQGTGQQGIYVSWGWGGALTRIADLTRPSRATPAISPGFRQTR